MGNNVYDDSSITQLKGAERVRLRPAAILGSNGLEGAKHTVIEIIGNATDEKLAGYGDKLDIKYDDAGYITVRDYGRGVPLGWNEKENNWNYFLIYEELYAGGKYSSNKEVLEDIEARNAWDNFRIEDYNYLVSIGLNGLGAASTQFTSEHFDVISYRDGKASHMAFHKGCHSLEELEIFDTDEPNGTYICWKPDDEVFTDTKIPAKWFEKLCKSLAYVSGFNVTFEYKGNVTEYPASSIADVLKNETGESLYTHAFKHVRDAEDDICICDAEVAIGPEGKKNEFYHNRVEVSGGSHTSGFNSGLYAFFAKISRDTGVKIKEVDYANNLSIIISTLANKASMRNQTKDSIDDYWILNFLSDTVYGMLVSAHEKGVPWVLDIVERVIQNANNRIAVQEMSKNMREIETTTKRHKVSHKFSTCRSYENRKSEETEFLIVEGDSAGGAVLRARDSRFQCLLPIRGKSLNVYKASIAKLIANKEILDIISVLGCGIDLDIEGYTGFNLDNLRVGKVIFCADADVDGWHINMLLLLIFFKLFPQLLYQGRIYIALPPLYIVNLSDGNTVYCMNEEELDEAREKYGSKIRSIDRFKGLGEMDKEVLWNSTLNPQTRNLKQIKIESNDMDIYDTLEVLFGKSTERRKQAILGSMLGTDYEETLSDMESIADMIEQMNMNDDLEIEEVGY